MRWWLGGLGALIAWTLNVGAQAAVSPVISQAGFNCPVEQCGDLISALELNGGYPPPFNVDGIPNTSGRSEFKPNIYYFEVPAIDPSVEGAENDINNTIPFVIEWRDIGAGGSLDACLGSCDTATVIRIYPPAYAAYGGRCQESGVAPERRFAELVIEASPDDGNFDTCQFLRADGDVPFGCGGGDCCEDLDGASLVLSLEQLTDPDFFTPDNPVFASAGIDRDCVGPGVWKMEIDTSQSSRFARARSVETGGIVPESSLGFDDIDVFRFSITQNPERCVDPSKFVRVYASAVNVAANPNSGTLEAVLFADVSGGWLAGVDTSLQPLDLEFPPGAETPGAPPLRRVLPPGQESIFDLTAGQGEFPDLFFAVQTTDQAEPQGGANPRREQIVRQELPFAFLRDGVGDFVSYQNSPFYPYPISSVDAQGLWGFELAAQTFIGARPSAITITVRTVETATDVELNDVFAELPDRSNVGRIYFPFDPAAFPGDACAEKLPGIEEGSETDLENVSDQLRLASKPRVIHEATEVGLGGRTAGGRIICFQQETRLVNPEASNGALSNFGLTAVVPGIQEGRDVRILGISECQNVRCSNCSAQGIEGCPSSMPSFSCPSTLDGFEPSSGEFLTLQFVNDLDTPRLEPFNISAPNASSAFVRYVLAADVFDDPTPFDSNPGPPTFLTGRGPNGNRGRWRDETTPDVLPAFDPPSDPSPFVIDQSSFQSNVPFFGFPGGGEGDEDGDGGTSTSTEDPDDPDPTRASIIGVRTLATAEGIGEIAFETEAEIGTGAFQVVVSDGQEEIPIGRLLPVRPGGAGGLYRVAVSLVPGVEIEIAIDEYELAGGRVRHGPYALRVQEAPALQPLERGDYGFAARPLQPDPIATSPTLPLNAPAASDRARVTVNEAGLYRLSYRDLADSLTPSTGELAVLADGGALRLSRGDVLVPYRPDLEGIVFYADGRFDETSDTLDFVIELGRGQRLSIQNRELRPQTAAATVRAETRFERDVYPAVVGRDIGDGSFWMWDFLLAGDELDGTRSFEFDTPGVESSEATLQLLLRGGSQGPVFPDHEVEVRINGVELGVDRFFGFDARVTQFDIPEGVLSDAGNTLELVSTLREGLRFSVEWLDSFSIIYRRGAVAAANQARVLSSGETTIRIDGFTSNEVEIWRLLNGKPVHAVAGSVLDDSPTGVAVSFANGAGSSEYLAFVPDELPPVNAIRPLGGGELFADTSGAEYVVLAHPTLLEGATELARYRASQGLSTEVVDVQDVYDFFNGGSPSADALSRFVREWYRRAELKPRYITIIGDGTYDVRNRLGHGDNLIAPPLLESDAGRFGSDTGLGDVTGEAGYEIAVGRIPAQTSEDLDRYIDKLKRFEASDNHPGSDRAFVVADNPDQGGDFRRSLADALGAFSPGFFAEGVAIEAGDATSARDRLFAALDDGARYLHFIGHGGLLGLAEEGVLTREDVGSFDNAESPAVLLAAACLLGRFDFPGSRSVSEELLLKGESGAAAVYASAGLESNASSTALMRLVGRILGERKHRRLGAVLAEASMLAAAEGIGTPVLELHTLQGDPALLLEAEGSEWRSALPPDSDRFPETDSENGCRSVPSGTWWGIALVMCALRYRQKGSRA